MMTDLRLDPDSVPAFYRSYVVRVKEGNALDALRNSGREAQELVRSVPATLADHRYSEGKWSIRETLCHMMDAERVFAYRALRFARNDPTPLPGFEQDDYATEANAAARSPERLAEEMARLRAATIDLYESFTPEMLRRAGVANNNHVTVLAIGFVIAGHDRHHLAVLREHYLSGAAPES